MQGIFLREYIEERAMESARYIVKNKATVRQAAKVFGISKMLDVNKAERHLRGGMATREKYSHMRK